MAFHKSIIESHSWDAFTLAEDVEFFLKLVDRDTKIDFAPDAKVMSGMPTSLKDSTGQNLRWEKGRVQMARTYGLPYLFKGLLRGNLDKAFAGLDQLVLPLSINFLMAVVVLVASVAAGHAWMIGISLVINLALAGHIFIGLISSRAPLKVYRAFLFAPWFILWKVIVYIRALKPGHLTWTKTERS
jgi:cellulose synthase/poly-beta-1,6-N-acetylglucosamine synthase-like glycosyltransferase